MFTKNFANAMLQGAGSGSGLRKILKNMTGDTISAAFSVYNLYGSQQAYNFEELKNSNRQGYTLVFGSGATPTTLDTFDMENILDNSLFTYINMSFTNEATSKDGVNPQAFINYVFRYEGSEPITIREVAIVYKSASSVVTDNSKCILMARDNCNISLNTGDTFSITMTIG